MDKILESALRDYKAEFGQDFDPTWAPTTDEHLADKLRASKVDFDSWRSKHQRMWEALTAIALPISNLGKIAVGATTSVFPPAAAAVTGLLALVTACEKVSTAYDYIEDMFVKLEDVLSRWTVDSQHDIDDLLLKRRQQIVLVVFYIITRSRKLLKNGRSRQYVLRTLLGDDKKTADLMRELDDLIQSEDRARMTLSLGRMKALWEKAIQSENAQFVEKLQSPAVEINQSLYMVRIENKLPGTGQWLKEEPPYQNWMHHDSRFLLILGVQGSGKSYLATSIIEDLTQKHHRHDSQGGGGTTSTAYFYFEQQHDLITMLKTMAYQIQKTNHLYRQHVIDTLDQGSLSTAKETWTKLFLDFWNDQVSPAAKLMIVVNGLSNGAPSIVESFAQDMVKTLKKDLGYNIQLAILGKLQLLVDFDFVSPAESIEIDSKKNKEDVAAYVDQELSKHKLLLRKAKMAEKAEIKQKIVDSSEEIFEYARLLLERCKKKELHQIRDMLNNPPKMDDMIKSCFDQIMADDDVDPPMLRTILTCLTYSKRRLQFGEIYNAVRVTTGQEYAFLWRNIVYFLSTVIRWKSSQDGGLRHTDIDKEGDDYIEVLEDEEKGWSKAVSFTWIFLGNSRIRDYVVNQSQAIAWTDGMQSHWPPPPQKSECEMVKMCIAILQQEKATDLNNQWLLLYPLHYMFSHLKNIDLATASTDDKATIATGLIWLFYKQAGHYVMALGAAGAKERTTAMRRFWQLWVETKDNVAIVQIWLQWAIDNDLTSDVEITTWLDTATTSYKAFFQPFAAYARRMWARLDMPPQSWSEYTQSTKVISCGFAFLLAYDNLDEYEEPPERYQVWTNFETTNVSVEEVIASAKKIELLEGTEPILPLALTFARMGRHNLIIRYAKRIAKDSKAYWAAAWLQARAHAGRSEFEQALYWYKIAADNNPRFRGQIGASTAIWTLRIGDAQGALQAAEATYCSMRDDEDERTISSLVRVYFQCLSLHQRWPDITKIARQLDELPAKDLPYSMLIRTLEDGYGYDWIALGQAFMFSQSQDDRSFIMKIIRTGDGLLCGVRDEECWITWFNCVALFTRRFVENGLEKCRALAAANLVRIDESRQFPDETVRVRLRAWTLRLYSDCTYEWALEQERVSDPQLADTVTLLENLSRDARQIDKSLLTTGAKRHVDAVSFNHGLWLRTHNTKGSNDWMTFFREPLLMHLSMLDDATPQNDLFGFQRTQYILQRAGDFRNAHALLAVCLLQLEEAAKQATGLQDDQDRNTVGRQQTLPSRQSTEDQLSAQTDVIGSSLVVEELEGSRSDDSQSNLADGASSGESDSVALDLDVHLVYTCGCCQVTFSKVDAMFTCRQCYTTCCNLCLPQGPTHPVRGRQCGNHHEHVQSWPLPEDQKHLAAVKEGGRFRLRRSWLQKLRKEWSKPDDEGRGG